MPDLLLRDFHAAKGASFLSLGETRAVFSYGPGEAEYAALTQKAAVIDLSFRGRICLLGNDREKFLHGQVTNDVLGLKPGEGCYAALVSTKARMESDLFVYKLGDELLLDFEPGLTTRITDRLNRFIIADDVQIVDVAAAYGHLHIAGPLAAELLSSACPAVALPSERFSWSSVTDENGEIYAMNNPRFGVVGYDLFAPTGALTHLAEALTASGGLWVGLEATEIARVENGIPRYGIDMNENTIPQEAELQGTAISFAKGCYIGQEIIARIRTYGQVAKALRLLRIPGSNPPPAGTPILSEDKHVGHITSAVFSPKYASVVALGYVRKEHFATGTHLWIGSPALAAEVLGPPWSATAEASPPAAPNRHSAP